MRIHAKTGIDEKRALVNPTDLHRTGLPVQQRADCGRRIERNAVDARKVVERAWRHDPERDVGAQRRRRRRVDRAAATDRNHDASVTVAVRCGDVRRMQLPGAGFTVEGEPPPSHSQQLVHRLQEGCVVVITGCTVQDHRRHKACQRSRRAGLAVTTSAC